MSKSWIVTLFPEGEKPYREIITGKTLRDVIYTLESKDGYDVDLGKMIKFTAEKTEAMV